MNLNPSTQLNLFEHKEIFNQLYKLYKNDILPNKILLSGEKGIGKSTTKCKGYEKKWSRGNSCLFW